MTTTKKRVAFVRSPNREANERFVHLRKVDRLYTNGRRVNNVTAFIRTIDGEDFASFAENDERDQFCKRTGRNVARRKWFQGKRTLLQPAVLDGDSLYERAIDTWLINTEDK
jgi:hypothetical protein